MSKTLPGYETVLLMPSVEIAGVPWIITPTGLVDFSTPTAAALNVYQSITKPNDTNAGQGGNVSCAILDDMDLGLSGSDTDDQKTLCSKGNTSTLTLYKFNAKMSARIEDDRTLNTQANLFYNLVRRPDCQYFVAHRVKGGKDSTETFAIGDEVDLYYVHTDNPVPLLADGKPIGIQQNFIQKAVVNVGYVLAA